MLLPLLAHGRQVLLQPVDFRILHACPSDAEDGWQADFASLKLDLRSSAAGCTAHGSWTQPFVTRKDAYSMQAVLTGLSGGSARRCSSASNSGELMAVQSAPTGSDLMKTGFTNRKYLKKSFCEVLLLCPAHQQTDQHGLRP